MPMIGGHRGVWIAAGLWAVAAPLHIALVAATVAPPAEPANVMPPAPARPVDTGREAGGHGRPEDEPAASAGRPSGPSRRGGAIVRLEPDVRIIVHKVAPGDGLISLARGYLGSGRRWREIAEANEIPPPYVLEQGRSVRIPMARAARAEARLELLPPQVAAAVTAPPAEPVEDVNLTPPAPLEPPRKALAISRPLVEAYPWRLPFHAVLGFAGVTVIAAGLAIAGAKRRSNPASAARTLWWGAVAGSGACALAASLAIFVAGAMSHSASLQFLFAAAAGGATGAAAFFAAKSTPGADEQGAPLHALALRFGYALGWLTSSALAASAMTGWLPGAMNALRLS